MHFIRNKDVCYINRIRLINFHNFVDETIEVINGGHLFMLGDNGSGKTTVIDAVHYVLTAGQSMEFNSAARVTGRKNDGRRAQGIISRYNTGIGHMNPDGAVTYAALELQRGDRFYVIGVGMSINSPEDNLNRWGIVRDGVLEDIPFMVTELEGKRPASKFEMRNSLDRIGYYNNINQYRKILAERFVGDLEAFNEFCAFLHMCKAYREIVSSASDYHSLFKKLLPEKRIDLFETIINSLREIESNSGELEALYKRLDYIDDLENKVEEVKKTIGEIICLNHQRTEFNIAIAEKQENKLLLDRNTCNSDLDKGRLQLTELEAERDLCGKMLIDLQSQDAEGLLEKENDNKEQLKNLDKNIKVISSKEQELRQKEESENSLVENKIQELKDILSGQLTTLSKLSPQLPFQTSNYMQALDAMIHEGNSDSPDSLPINEMRHQADTSQGDNLLKKATFNNKLQTLKTKEQELTTEISTLEKQGDVYPQVNYFKEAEKTLKNAMISAIPLYRLLEWKSELTPETCSCFEEAIGDHLATFLVHDKDFEAAAKAVFPDYPGIRIAIRRDLAKNEVIADWIKDIFDFNDSDPEAILVLHDEMLSATGLSWFSNEDYSQLNFRAHSQALSGKPARLIGEHHRQQELQRILAEKRTELNDCRLNQETIQAEISTLEKQEQAINEFKALLNDRLNVLHKLFSELNMRKNNLLHIREKLQSASQELQSTQANYQMVAKRLEELRKTIAERGLQELEQRIKATEDNLSKIRYKEKECQINIGKLEKMVEDISTSLEELYVKKEGFLESKEEIEAELKSFCASSDINSYFEFVSSQWNISTLDEFNTLYQKTKELLQQDKTIIEQRLLHPEGAKYGFVYDADENKLYDRNQCDISDLVSSLRKSITEQEEIINDKTNELFKNVIQEALVHFIIENIHRLRGMVKDINKLLSQRKFGMNSYSLKITPIKEYERFVKTFENFNSFNSTSASELQDLISDHKEDILNSEVSTIPEVLDYRNWFQYDMIVKSDGAEDGEVITRRLRNMGSGGEQAVPNYLLILTIANFLYLKSNVRLHVMLFDEAFYGIDEERRNQLLGFASDLGLQLFVASPDQDGVRKEIAYATSLIVVKDEHFDVHLFPHHFENPGIIKQGELFAEPKPEQTLEFGDEL